MSSAVILNRIKEMFLGGDINFGGETLINNVRHKNLLYNIYVKNERRLLNKKHKFSIYKVSVFLETPHLETIGEDATILLFDITFTVPICWPIYIGASTEFG